MLKPVDLYIDLGTANTLIYAKNKGFLLNEPSVLAIRHRGANSNEFFALGRPAKEMLGKNPQNLSVVRPLREGVIADFENTSRMLHLFIKRVKESLFLARPRMIISLPCQVSQFEKKAVEEVGYSLGASKVHLLDEPVAAAIGAGLAVLEHHGRMVVDIGGGTTEIAVIALGGIVASSAVRIGGNDIDAAIIEHMKDHHNFLIGEQTAERAKITVASADLSLNSGDTIEMGGFDLIKGLPGKFEADANTLYRPVNNVVSMIVDAIKRTLEQCPPEIAADIGESGIVLAGGGALLRGLQSRLEREIGVKTSVSPEPLLSVAMGGAKVLEDNRLFDAIERPA